MEHYRGRACLGPLRAVLDEGDVDGRKNAYTDLVERVHLRRALRGCRVAVAVDVGAGPCRLTALLAERATLVLAVDASDALLASAVSMGLPARTRAIRGDVAAIPLRDGAADVCLAANVLMHMVTDDDLGRAAREIARCLAHGGRAVLLEPVAPGPRSIERDGVAHRSVRELVRPFLAAGLVVSCERLIRKMPSRLLGWARTGRLPRPIWGLAARLEPVLATRGREEPSYREALVVLEKPGSLSG